jgi:hypothetical protein
MNRLRPFAPLLLLAGAIAVVFHRLLLGEVFFWGLPSLQFTPWRVLALDMLGAGQLPLWNALNGAGAPLLANYQSALLYPLHWPGYALPTAWAMSASAVVHLFIAGCGMWAFTGALGANGLGRGVSALAFGLTSYLVARASTYPIVTAAAWLPWLMWAVHALSGPRPARAAFWLTVFAALLLLAGHAQTAWYSLLLAGLYALYRAAALRRGRPLWWAAGAVALAASVAALQLVPTAELLLSSQRGGGVERDFALNFSYAPVRALNLFAPFAFGGPADGTYYTNGVFFEDAVYVGLLPLIAALVALLKWPWCRRAADLLGQAVPFFGAAVLIALLLAMGTYTPVFPFLFDHVPTFDLFQAPVRWHLWTAFGLAALSAIGVTWWVRGGSWSRRSVAFSGAALAVGGVGSLVMTDPSPALAALLRAVVTASALVFAAVVLTLLKPALGKPAARGWSAVVLLIVAVDLIWAGWGLNPTTSARFYDPRPTEAADRAFWPKDALDTVMYDTHLRVDDYRMSPAQIEAYRASGLPNLNVLDGAGLFSNFDPLLVGGHAQYVALLNTEPTDALLRAAGISVVYDGAGALLPVGTDTAPLAWMVRSACFAEGEDAALRLKAADWDPYRQVILAGEGPCDAAEEAPAGAVLSASGDMSSFEVDAVADGWLVVAATDYPDWTAQVDGVTVSIERANLAFRAVPVGAGRHTVTFAYAPAWLLPSALVSLAGVIGLIGVFALARREHRYNANRVKDE